MKFNFDREYWHRDRQGYLISLGIEPRVVHELLNNPNHPYYIELAALQTETSDMVITIDISDLLDTIIKDNSGNNNDERK